MFTLNCKGKLLTLQKPLVMGIINVTPDSFYRGNIDDDMIELAGKMIADGADILDIGGQSTRPNSTLISEADELKRVVPVIKKIQQNFPNAILSIDTFYSKVAEAAVAEGASIVNDISAGNMDDKMIETVASLHIPYICMHMQGSPQTMQLQTAYKNIITDIIHFFDVKINACIKAGIKDIIIDLGFGFSKTTQQNFLLLKNLSNFSIFEKPILVGISRKKSIYQTLNITANEALNGTTALHSIALMNGASILRVHDVKEAKEAITLFEAYKNS